MWLFVTGCGSPLDTPASSCAEIEAAYECGEGPEGDVSSLWRDRTGYGWADRAVWSSESAVNLYVEPGGGFGPGAVEIEVPTKEIHGLQIVVGECDFPYCPWAVEGGSVHVTGELTECPVDTSAAVEDPCVAGTLTFTFTALTFASGGTTEPMVLDAGFGPDRPGL